MKVSFGRYSIVKEDSLNFGLYKTVAKGTAFGKGGEGTTEKRLGYYGILSSAINKMLNNEILEADEVIDLETLLKRISTLETLVKSKFNIKPKDLF